MEMTAPKAIEAMQALANQISFYDLRLKEPIQVMAFLREELASQEAPESGEEGSSSTPTDPEAAVR